MTYKIRIYGESLGHGKERYTEQDNTKERNTKKVYDHINEGHMGKKICKVEGGGGEGETSEERHTGEGCTGEHTSNIRIDRRTIDIQGIGHTADGQMGEGYTEEEYIGDL